MRWIRPACWLWWSYTRGQLSRSGANREDCALGKEGVSLLGISKAEKRLHSPGGRITFEALANEAPLPASLTGIRITFVVVYKVKKFLGNYRVYVADPGKGSLTYTKEEFYMVVWFCTKPMARRKASSYPRAN